MSDYISREALIKKLHSVPVLKDYPNLKALCFEWANALPAADVVEVRHGEWIKGIHMVECSVCSDKFDFGDETWVDDYDIVADIGWKHCPNCGAKMDGGADK